MMNSHVTQQHTVADEGDVNVVPYPPGCGLATQPRSRQLLPTPQVPPLASEGKRK
jgi:hypothetical protein